MRILAALAAAVAALAFAAPARADLLIQVDKSAQRMTVSADGALLYTWPVSTGIARYDTPNGAYTPFRKEKEHFSREWDDAPMPYSIFFTMKGHAIHGTNHKSLGHPASHGCVRLSVANAATLWGLVAKHKMANTTVVLTGTIPAAGDEPKVARLPRVDQRTVTRSDQRSNEVLRRDAEVLRDAQRENGGDVAQNDEDDDPVVVPPRPVYRDNRGYWQDRRYYDDGPYYPRRGLFPFFGR